MDEASSRPPRGRLAEVGLLAVAAATIALVLWRVDLAPRVESGFFFATDDPQLQASEQIERRFPSRPQLILRAAAEALPSAEHEAKVQALSDELAKLPGVASVQSLARGPASPAAALASPFWRRLLVAPDGKASNLIVQLGKGEPRTVVAAVEGAARRSGLEVVISGVPYVVELIRRSLLSDLETFSVGAILVFALVIGLLFRSPRVVVGTLGACLTACAATLGLLGLTGHHIGLLTANLVTIVFVLTLSHALFMTTNWRRLALAAGSGRAQVREAVRLTLPASFWCMTATGLGFLSLLWASAKPLRELGLAGALGTAVAILVAYLFVPPFLLGVRPSPALGGLAVGGEIRRRPGLVLMGLCLLAGLGVFRLSTDASLLSYFKPGSALRVGLEKIDADGGSSPLSLIVADDSGGRVDGEPVMAKLKDLQARLDAAPDVGVSLSVVPLVAEARQASPFAALLPAATLLDVLAQPAYDQVSLAFVAADRQEAHVFLRMREGARQAPRAAVMASLAEAVRASGLELRQMGGLFELQGKLADLVAGSLLEGLLGLLVLFFFIGAWVARSLASGLAMVASLALIPLFLLGLMGLLGFTLDFISSPGAQVAIGIGVDSMIQLAAAARRARQEGLAPRLAWQRARAEMGRAVISASVVIALGFGLFALSSFPPTQRFGFAVGLGTLASGAIALYVLPLLAAGRPKALPS